MIRKKADWNKDQIKRAAKTLMNGGTSYQVALEHDVPVTAVYSLTQSLRKRGLKIPVRRTRVSMGMALAELKAENPSYFA